MKIEKYVFVTKYALTSGIFKLHCVVDDVSGYARQIPTHKIGYFLSKGEYFDTLPKAIANAEERRIKKLKSLDKQIKKISAIKFDCE